MSHALNLQAVSRITAQGSSLIEVMVALFVLAIGLLGALSMQVKSMQYTQSAYYYSQAMYLASEILESMRSNSGYLSAYDIPLGDTASLSSDCFGVVCSGAELSEYNVYEWRGNVANSLVSGQSSISTTSTGQVTITLQYSDQTKLSEYVLVTEIN